ncbi:hypothetical protein C3F09_04810 [candidate division GN15 bacterium]|uniref:Periplasmic heavy metal sensor n=1 Tax=candidate division GN15 bacterium TaxID=2072418 RepID=A0A855X2X3_9BACT|nr:MAG: hypothetical protein C3F09_04810 [candidate division GN15 bacterium]
MLVAIGSAAAQDCPAQGRQNAQVCQRPEPGTEFAQNDSEFDRPVPPPGEMPPMGMPHGGRGRGFERLRMAKLIELLQLTDTQRAPFLEAFRKMRHQQREVERQRMEILDEMSQMLKSDRADEKMLNIKTDELSSLARERCAGMEEFVSATRAILTPTQVAKMAIFQERFDAAALRMLRDRMLHPGGPGGSGMSMPHDSFRDEP